MKVLVFGATGATGVQLVRQGLDQTHEITAFLRTPAKLKIQHKNLAIFKGDVSNFYQVNEAVSGQQAVISALGASSPFKHDHSLIRGIENIVSAMTGAGVDRFIYQSFLGVSEYRKDLGFINDKVMPLILRNVIKDHETKERIIMDSHLKWTIIRCAMLTNNLPTGKYIHGERITSKSLIPGIARADVADFMLREISGTTYINKKPRIMER